MNSVCLVGRLTRAPVVRFEGEHQTATFTLAVDEPSREGKAFTLYVGCVSWGRSAEVCSLLNAQDRVELVGKLSWRKHLGTCRQEHSQLCVQVRELAVLEAAALTGRN